MASAATRMAGKVGGPLSKVAGKAAESGSNPKNQEVLQKGAKRDPELYVRRPHRPRGSSTHRCQILLAIMTGAFGLAGFHFGAPQSHPLGHPVYGGHMLNCFS